MIPYNSRHKPSTNSVSGQSLLDIQDIELWEPEYQSESLPLATRPNPSHKKRLSEIMDYEQIFASEKRALQEIGNINWVGKLNEFRMSRIRGHERTEAEFKINHDYSHKSPRFSCSVKIPESPSILGDTQDPTTFSAKKPAKQYAAKKAIDWLIKFNFMAADGSAHFSSLSKESIASKVPDLCRRLGLNTPRYVIEPIVPSSPMYSGYADFGGDPRIKGFIGQVTGFYGKKNAKDHVAREVVTFLTQLLEERNERILSTRKRLQ
ncbi:putative adenosine rna-specific isoform adar-a variant [Erysiphe necator]|uniref:Putative adenosine rna-specific isoform adar-a variant n=1 Tax=Uncinula necator TaxID=52586 RepID=A0A0B1NZS8_UNCNE|nr:putative adenosine rna-specific isoform adar-a variant [Erysiphe necator]